MLCRGRSISLARAHGSYPALTRRLEKTDLLILDDWGLYPLEADGARYFFDILEDRSHSGSVIIVSQIPVSDWYDLFNSPSIADGHLGPAGPQCLQNRNERRFNAEEAVAVD